MVLRGRGHAPARGARGGSQPAQHTANRITRNSGRGAQNSAPRDVNNSRGRRGGGAGNGRNNPGNNLPPQGRGGTTPNSGDVAALDNVSLNVVGTGGVMHATNTSDGDSKCGICNFNVGDDAVGCDVCSNWFHPTPLCTGLKPEAIDIIMADPDSGVFYKCNICRCSGLSSQSPGAVRSSQTGLSDPITASQLFEMIKSLTMTVTNLANQVSVLTSREQIGRQDHVERSDGMISREELYSELWEFEERKKRRESLIVRGTNAQNSSDFSRCFEEISTHLTGTAVVPDEIHRIGSGSSTPLYRVKIRDSAVRMRLLSSARDLKSSDQFKDVYINRDLTFKQRSDLRARRLAQNPNLNATESPHPASAAPTSDQVAAGRGDF